MKTLFALFIVLLTALGFTGQVCAQGGYATNTASSGAGGQTTIKVEVSGTTGTTYNVFVNGVIVHSGTVTGGGRKKFNIPVSALPADADVKVTGDTSGQVGPYIGILTV
jgi:hypothetical protein